MPREKSSRHDEQLPEMRAAIERLLELSTKIPELAKKKLRPVASKYKSLLGESEAGQNIADRVRRAADAIESFFRVRAESDLALGAFANGLQYLREAQSIDEISTLTGFTLLSEYNKYSAANSRFLRDFEAKLAPMKDGLATLIDFAGEVYKIGGWLNGLLDYDVAKKEDNISRMLTAIQKLDLNLFRDIYEKTKRKIEAEENRLHEQTRPGQVNDGD